MRRVLAALLLVVGLVALGSSNACSDDDRAPSRVSRRGEACQVTSDCADGLSCMPVPGGAGGLCVTGVFRIEPTGKECAIVECSLGADCCETPKERCAELFALCQTDAGARDACDAYDRLCGCERGERVCSFGRCESRCTDDFECTRSSGGRRCAGGTCVACAFEDDCPAGRPCVNGKCTPPCSADGDCAGFDRCVDGKCLPSGCLTDRECVAATRKVDARCGTAGRCIVPCQTDLECDNPTAFSFFACIQNECTYVGCETDKDCSLLLVGDAGFLSPKQHVVCREKNPVTGVGGTTP
ncbi:MAG: hypothetical protein KF819_33665 [Labilithrix sp.]|nr:hypothetical protein [Labilithrix sp.]